MTLTDAFLAVFPHLGAQLSAHADARAADLFAHRAAVIERAAASQGVPAAVLGAVCWSETRLGAWRAYASLCGVRLDHRYIADDERSATIAARTLAHLFAQCRTWPRAFARYRTGGACGNPAGMGYALRTDGTAARLRFSMTRGAR